MILVAEPVLQELETAFKKNGWVENSSDRIERIAATSTPNSRQRYACQGRFIYSGPISFM